MKPEERFEVGSSVGKDELGEVFEAKAKDGGARVALKVFEDWTTEKEQSRDAWAKALEQLQQIGPARTPRIEGACVQQSAAWLATRWVDGPSLADVLKQQQLDENMAATIGCGILDALAELHESGEAHGGLTTNKVILTQGFFTGGVIITDPFQHYLYSVAEPVKAEAERYIGLPAYYSPEQARGEVPDFRSDIYVIGLMLYEMIVGTTPFASPSREMTLRRQMAEPAMAISLAKPGTNVSQDFHDILNLALNKDPGQRFQNPLAMRRALANCRAFGDEEMERNAEPLGVSRGADVAASSSIIIAAGAGAAAASVAAEQAAAAEKAAAEQAAAEQAAAEQAAAEQAAAEQAAAEQAAAEQAAAEQAAAEQAAAEQAAAEQAAAEQAAAEQAAAEQAAAEQAAAEQAAAEQAAAEQAAAEESSVEVDSSLGATVSDDESASDDAASSDSNESAAAMAADLDYGFDDEQTNSWFAAGFDAGEMEEKHGEPEVPTFTEVKQKSNRVGAVIIVLTVIAIVATVFFISRGAGDDTPEGVGGAQEAAAEGDDSEEQRAADEAAEADEEVAPTDDAAAEDGDQGAEVGEDAGAEADPAAEDAAGVAEGDVAAAAAADGATGEEAAAQQAEDAAGVAEGDVAAAAAADGATGEEAAAQQAEATEEEVAAAAAPAAAAQEEPAAEAQAEAAPAAEEANDEAADEARAQELLEEGLAAYNSGNNDSARRLLSEAVTLDGGLTRAHRALGDIYFSERDFSRAARHFRASGAHLELGQAYYRLGEFEDALEAFERAEARGDANAARYIELTRSQLGE